MIMLRQATLKLLSLGIEFMLVRKLLLKLIHSNSSIFDSQVHRSWNHIRAIYMSENKPRLK